MNGENNILTMKGISKSFASVKVLDNITLSLGKGEILGLVGENGAGKSTLMNIMGGVYQCDEGEMFFDGEKYEPQSPLDAPRTGIAFIHQELNLFGNLSVAENFFIEELPLKPVSKTINYPAMYARTKEILAHLGEDISPNTLVECLSMGKRQMVEIAKSLSKNARVIIFDEPTTSLSTREKDSLFRIIRELAREGVGIIYISHTLDDVIGLSDRIAVIRDGKMIGVDRTENLTKDEVIRRMVGRDLNRLYPYVEKAVGEDLLRVESLTKENLFCDVNLTVRRGEIVGMFGLMGAGRSDLANAIFGVEGFDAGQITVKGTQYAKITPQDCIEHGMAFVTENRREEGLMIKKPASDNLALTILPQLRGRLGWYNRKKEDEITEDIIQKIRIKTHDKHRQLVGTFSGGNQQKVVIGKWLIRTPEIFLLDEPTRGIDVGAKYEIYSIINTLAEGGSGILMISSEMEELMGLCDRILVMCKGRLTGELQRSEFSMEAILKYALGEEIAVKACM